MPGGEHVDQRAELDAAGALGQDRIEQDDVRDDLEAVVVKVVLGRPHRVVAERVAGLRVGGEIGVGAAVALLAVVARVGRWPVDAGVWHVHGAIEERAEVHPDLPARAVAGALVCLSREHADLATPSSGNTPSRRTNATRARPGRAL